MEIGEIFVIYNDVVGFFVVLLMLYLSGNDCFNVCFSCCILANGMVDLNILWNVYYQNVIDYLMLVVF